VLRYKANGKDSLRCLCLESHVHFDVTWNRGEPAPPKGTIITYRYQRGLDTSGQPRFPQILRVRPDE